MTAWLFTFLPSKAWLFEKIKTTTPINDCAVFRAQGIQYLNARELEHTEGARLWSQSNVELEDYVTSVDPGYARLVEETGISLFKTEEDGTKTYLSRAEFENNFQIHASAEIILRIGKSLNQAEACPCHINK